MAFVLARYNTYQFSLCFTYSTTRFWNSLPNKAVLAVKQHRFITLSKKIKVKNKRINIYGDNLNDLRFVDDIEI